MLYYVHNRLTTDGSVTSNINGIGGPGSYPGTGGFQDTMTTAIPSVVDRGSLTLLVEAVPKGSTGKVLTAISY